MGAIVPRPGTGNETGAGGPLPRAAEATGQGPDERDRDGRLASAATKKAIEEMQAALLIATTTAASAAMISSAN
ncbi:hypothetical protein [Micromonospora sp. NPDC003776]